MTANRHVRIAAVITAALAVGAALLHLRAEPEGISARDARVVAGPGDALRETLRECAAIGEDALASPACRAAWYESRRRFFRGPSPERAPGSSPAPRGGR